MSLGQIAAVIEAVGWPQSITCHGPHNVREAAYGTPGESEAPGPKAAAEDPVRAMWWKGAIVAGRTTRLLNEEVWDRQETSRTAVEEKVRKQGGGAKNR